jgi:hypothetical protein
MFTELPTHVCVVEGTGGLHRTTWVPFEHFSYLKWQVPVTFSCFGRFSRGPWTHSWTTNFLVTLSL